MYQKNCEVDILVVKRIIEKMIDLYDMNDYVHIIEGDAIETIPKFEKDNPHLLFSLAYLDFDLYEPTIKALRFIKNRIVSGGLIAFDQALTNSWKGEGIALVEFLDKNFSDYDMEIIPFSREPTIILVRR